MDPLSKRKKERKEKKIPKEICIIPYIHESETHFSSGGGELFDAKLFAPTFFGYRRFTTTINIYIPTDTMISYKASSV